MKLIIKYFIQAIQILPKEFFKAIGMILLLSSFSILLPYGVKVFVETITHADSLLPFMIGLLLFVLFLGIQVLLKMQWIAYQDDFGGKYIEYMTCLLIHHLAYADYKEIDKKGSAAIKHILYADVLDLFRVIGNFAPSCLGSLIIISASLICSFFYDLKGTVLIIVSLILGLCISYVSRNMIRNHAFKTNQKLKKQNTNCIEFMDNLELIQNHSLYDYYQNKMSGSIQDFIQTAKKEDQVIYGWTGLVHSYNLLFKIVLSTFLALPIAGSSIVNVVFYTLLLGIIMDEANNMEATFQQIVKLQPAFIHVDDILQMKQKTGNLKDQITSVCFKNVSFQYANAQEMVLSDINCTCRKGDVIRLSGSNGSGKSTFVKLLIRLYEANEGDILLNHANILSYDVDELSRQIAYIQQDEQFLNESLQDYLREITHIDCSDSQFEQLKNECNLSIENIIIENNGKSLSVGQRKKLLMMKMKLLVERASIVILDECFAGMDLQTKQMMIDWLNECIKKQDKIFFIIEHDADLQLPFTHIYQFNEGILDIQSLQ